MMDRRVHGTGGNNAEVTDGILQRARVTDREEGNCMRATDTKIRYEGGGLKNKTDREQYWSDGQEGETERMGEGRGHRRGQTAGV